MQQQNQYSEQFMQAFEFAVHAHRNQTRKLGNEPFVMHPLNVARRLEDFGIDGNTPEGIIVMRAALLHDTLEDCPDEVTPSILIEKFGARTAFVVNAVSLDPKNPDKEESRRKIVAFNWMVRIVKVADVLSNTISLIEGIRKLGLSEVQKHFRKPLAERIRMESDFLSVVVRENDPEPLKKITEAAKDALFELGLECSSHFKKAA